MQLIEIAWVEEKSAGAVAKAILKRANLFDGLDTNPGELPMARWKQRYYRSEVPNPSKVQIGGMSCGER